MRRRTRVKHAAPPARGAAREGVQLAWARDRAGRKVRASRLAPADRRGLAPFTCLGCGDELVPHLGRIRTPHFAHRPGSTCPLTAPETALHLDTKERLLALCAEAFAGHRRVRALARCPECRRVTPIDLGTIGDAAEEEGAVGPLRADVLLRRGGRPALAIEVLVTHAVEPEKEAALGAAGVPAIEVDAREEWEGEDGGGTEIACARSIGFGPCPACRAGARADEERGKGGEAAEIAELESYRARGLLGAPEGPPPPAGLAPDAPLTGAELQAIRERFRCPDCGGAGLEIGGRLVRHACPESVRADRDLPPWRPVAWRGYDGSVATLRWWVPARPAEGGSEPRRAGKPR